MISLSLGDKRTKLFIHNYKMIDKLSKYGGPILIEQFDIKIHNKLN